MCMYKYVYVQVSVCASMCMCKYVWYEVGENEVQCAQIFRRAHFCQETGSRRAFFGQNTGFRRALDGL